MKDDLIRRETIIRALDKSISAMRDVAAGDGVMTKAIKLVEIARDFADNLPAVDAVEVVRCLECLYHAEQEGTDALYCGMQDIVMGAEDFCSFGVRRGNDG